MALIKNGKIVADPWLSVAAAAPLPDSGDIIVSLARWQAEKAQLLGRNAGIGVRLKNDQPVDTVAEHMTRFGVIALEFPIYRDGRAFSQARLVRERHKFRGELRATGNVLRDQLLFMQRCGFDAFETDDPRLLAGWRDSLGEFSVFYQPTEDGRKTADILRRGVADRSR